MTQPTPEEFEIIDDLKAVHRPTGWEFSTYRYADPAMVAIGWERLGVEGDYSRDELAEMALRLLRERARKRSDGAAS